MQIYTKATAPLDNPSIFVYNYINKNNGEIYGYFKT